MAKGQRKKKLNDQQKLDEVNKTLKSAKKAKKNAEDIIKEVEMREKIAEGIKNKGCFMCEQGVEAYEAWEQQAMEKDGWFAHYVTDGDNTPFGINYHTHGFEHTFNHPNLQICFPVRFEVMHQLVWIIVEDFLKKGVKLQENVLYEGIMGGGYRAQFINALECGRPVLRMIIPDPQGEYKVDPKNGLDYSQQFGLTDSNSGLPEEDKAYQHD